MGIERQEIPKLTEQMNAQRVASMILNDARNATLKSAKGIGDIWRAQAEGAANRQRLYNTSRYTFTPLNAEGSGVHKRGNGLHKNKQFMQKTYFTPEQRAEFEYIAERNPNYAMQTLAIAAYKEALLRQRINALEEQRKRHFGRDMNTLTGTFK